MSNQTGSWQICRDYVIIMMIDSYATTHLTMPRRNDSSFFTTSRRSLVCDDDGLLSFLNSDLTFLATLATVSGLGPVWACPVQGRQATLGVCGRQFETPHTHWWLELTIRSFFLTKYSLRTIPVHTGKLTSSGCGLFRAILLDASVVGRECMLWNYVCVCGCVWVGGWVCVYVCVLVW